MDVAPLYFVDAQGNPIAANLQQEYWNYLVKYKLFGNDFVKTGNRVIIHDESGWTGSNGYFKAEQPDGNGTSVGTQLGGPVVVAGNITVGQDYKFTTGPVRAESFTFVDNCGTCYFGAPICLNNTTVTSLSGNSLNGNTGFQAQPISNCPDQPSPNTAVSIPLLEWPASSTVADIKISANNGEQRIVVPDPVDGSKAPYDIYMDSILTGIGGTDGAKITVSMPAGGRVTRIFVHQIQLGNHTVIQIVYRTPQEDGSVVEVPAEKYAGNLLFYTDHDINIKNTDNSILLGTYVSTGRIYLQSNINFAGQLIANELVVGNEFDGRSFVFVPIDPPVLDLKPQADTPLEFPENDLLVKVPIALDTPAPADVFIDYCFDLQNSSAKESDFKLEDGYSYPKSKGHLFPICGQNMGKVTILKDAKTPADAPDVSVWINVAKDELVERPNETLRLKITNISGAVLPGNKLDGYFDLIIVDANIEPTSENFEITATEDEVFTFDSSMFKYESAFDKVEQGVVIMSLPEKGFLLSNGDTLTSSDLNKFIPINETTNIDLQFIAAKDEYGVSPAYTSFTFKMKDADNVVSEKPYTVTVKVNPVNDKPTITADTIKIGEVDHEVKSGSIVGADVENDALTYSFDDAFDATYTEANYNKVKSLYEMDPSTGAVSVKSGATLDYESADSVLTIRVKVVDDAATTSGVGKDSAYAVVVLQIVDQNEAPVVRDTSFTVDENVLAGTEVGQVVAMDPDIKSLVFGVLKYSIVETDVPFAIDNQGVITVSADSVLDFETKPSWTIHVTVTDGFLPQTVEVVIIINDLNEPPHIEEPEEKYNVVENTSNGVVFASIKVADLDGDDGRTTLTAKLENLIESEGVTAEDLFEATVVEDATDHSLRIVITVKDSAKLDYEALLANGENEVLFDVRLLLTDRGGAEGSLTDTAFTTIFVTDENEKPTVEDGDFTIAENSAAGTLVGKVVASDPDTANAAYGTLYYSFVETSTQFEIDATGTIRVLEGAVLDYETTLPDHKITLHVRVTDGVFADTATVTVTLTDENEPPEIIDDGEDYEVVENTAAGTEIARLEIKDVDAADANFATSLVVSLADNASHAIKAQTLFETVVKSEGGKTYAVIQVKSVPNFEEIMAANGNDSTFSVTITLKDQQGAAGCNVVPLQKKITVRDDNEAPIIAETPIYTVKENSAAGTSVGKVDAYDEDLWMKLTFTLVDIPGGDNVASLFKIDDNGNITVAAGANLDYEKKNEYRVTVRVTDNGEDRGFTNLSDEAVITIQVTDEDEKPGFDDKYPVFEVAENSKAGTNVGTVTATDDDCKDNTCAALTYTLVADTVAANANDYKEFKIDASTGKITVAKDSTLNYEVDSLYYALVVVDDGTLTDTARVTIKIKDANDKPVIANKTVSVPENSKAGTVVDTIPATDEDTWSSLKYSLADVDPNDQVAKLFTVDNNGVIKVAKDSTLDYETRDEYQVWVIVTDNGASRGFANLSDTAVVTIKVGDVNEPPEFIDDGKPDYTVAENTATTTEVARYEIKDVDAADANFASSLVVSIADNNTQNAVLAESLFNIKVEKRNDSTFAVIRVVASPDFEAIKEANGDTAFAVTLTLKDQNGAQGCNEVTLEKKIYVTDVNEKPDVKDASFAIDENSKKGDSVGVVEASDPDKFNPNFGTLYYSLLDATAGSTPGADTLFNIDSTGKITVAENAVLNYEVTPVIYVKVRVTDKTLSDTALVTVTLNDVDENPKIIIDDGPDGEDDSDSLCVAHCDTTGRGVNPRDTLTVGVKENRATGTTVVAYTVSDEDYGEVSQLTTSLVGLNQSGADSLFGVRLTKVDTAWKVDVYVADGSKLDFEKINQNHSVLIIVTDPNDLADTIVRVIRVIDVNEAPTLEPFNKTIDENLPNGATVGALVAADPDTAKAFSHLTYTILGADTVPFKLDSNVIKVADSEQLDYETTPMFKFKVEVSDGEFRDTALVTINLNEVNESPKIIVDDGPDGEDDSDSLCIAYCDTTGRGVDPHGDSTLTVGVKENSSTGTVVFAYVVADEDVGEVSNLTPSMIDNKNSGADSLFTVAIQKGNDNKYRIIVSVLDSAKLDYETINPVHEVSVVVTDPRGMADTLVRKIEVIDINEPPTFESWPFEFTEHNEPGTVVGHVEHGEDVDTMAISGISKPENYMHDKFALTGGADGADTLFTLLPNGDLVANKTFNFETDPTEYTIYISLMDTLMPDLVETDTIHITLLDLNEDPWIETDSVVVEENVEKGTVIDTIEAKDLDLYDTVLTFTLVEDKSGCFDVSKSGVVTVKKDNCSELDYEKNHELPITVKVTDTKDASETKTIIVKITDVNEAPKIDDETITVREDTPIGTPVDTVKATDPDDDPKYSELVYTIVGGDSTVFQVDSTTGVVTLIDSLDYEAKSEYTLVVEVFDGEFRDTATVTIKVGNVIESSEVEITRAETRDTVVINPDTLYVNTPDVCIEWKADGKLKGPDCDLELHEGENIIIREFQDPTKDFPGIDTLVIYFSTATPVVTVSKAVDDGGKTNIFTIVEEASAKDTTFYVNETKNDILVTVTDTVTHTSESFTVKVELESVDIPSNTFKNTLGGLVDAGVTLNEHPTDATYTPVNGNSTAVTYTDKINGKNVTVTYYTDSEGNVIETADGIKTMTVTYTTEVEGREVRISYLADAVTGEVIQTNGGYTKQESGKDSKEGGKESGKGGKDNKDSKDIESENPVVFTVTYDYVDDNGNIMTVAYGVDAEGNLVKNEDGNLGYEVSYTYTNKYGNSATRSLFIVVDQVSPVVEIITPVDGEVVYTNFVDVKWTVNGEVQDTLITQALEKGANAIVRFYRDKAGNQASDTIIVIMKNAKDVDIAVEEPVTVVTREKTEEYYATNEPEEGETFAITIYNTKTDKEVETQVGGSFDAKPGSGDEPYPGLPGHLGPTLGIDTKVPTVNAIGGLATLDDIVGKDGLVPLEGVDAANSAKITVDEYMDKYCDAEFSENVGSDISRANLFKTKMYVKIWIYTSLGQFVDYYSFTQDLDNPDYVNDAGLLTMYFEMKPDRDGNVRTESGRLYATGAYVYKTEVELRSTLRCSVPPFTETTKNSGKYEPEKASNAKGSTRSVKEDLLKSFGYKRPEQK